MTTILLIIVTWFAISIPVGLFMGAFIRAGHGPKEEN